MTVLTVMTATATVTVTVFKMLKYLVLVGLMVLWKIMGGCEARGGTGGTRQGIKIGHLRHRRGGVVKTTWLLFGATSLADAQAAEVATRYVGLFTAELPMASLRGAQVGVRRGSGAGQDGVRR
eukprot:1722760-Pyramimonas_sp.AAC.1